MSGGASHGMIVLTMSLLGRPVSLGTSASGRGGRFIRSARWYMILGALKRSIERGV